MTALLPRQRRRVGGRTAPLRVGLCGLLGTGNLGNDGSLQAMLELLRAEYPNATIGCLCSGPREVQARFGIAATRLNWYRAEYRRASRMLAMGAKLLGKLVDPVRTWAWVRRYDVVIVPGMGVLEGSLRERPWGWPYSLLLVCLAGRCTGTPVALVSVGADTLARPWTRRIAVWAARLAHYRSFRDTLSRDAVCALGLDAAADEIYPDLAFALPVPPEQPVQGRAIGVGVMAYPAGVPETGQAVGHRHYLDQMTGFVAWLLDSGHNVRLLTGDREDEAVAAQVRANLRARRPLLAEDRVVVTAATSLSGLMELIRPLDAVVATRYHNIVCAVRLGKPTVSIGYSVKNDVLMADMGMPDSCQHIASFNVPQLIRQLDAVRARQAVLAPLMAERNRAHADQLRQQLSALAAATFPTPSAVRRLDR